MKETYGSIHGAIGGAYHNALQATHTAGAPHVGVVTGGEGAWRLAVVALTKGFQPPPDAVAVVQSYVTDANRPAQKAPKEPRPNKKALAKAAREAAKGTGAVPAKGRRGAALAATVELTDDQKLVAMKTLAARRSLFPDSPEGVDTANAAAMRRAVKSRDAAAIAIEGFVERLTREARMVVLDGPDPVPDGPPSAPEDATDLPVPTPATPLQGVSGGDPSPDTPKARKSRSTGRRDRAGGEAGTKPRTPPAPRTPRATGARGKAGDAPTPAPVLTRPAPKPSARRARTKAK